LPFGNRSNFGDSDEFGHFSVVGGQWTVVS
jgi:hypothetical protein